MDERQQNNASSRHGAAAARDERADALKALPFSDWRRLWCNRRAEHLPESVAREVQLAITSFSLDVMTFMTFVGVVSTTVITFGLVPLTTLRGQLWCGLQVAVYSMVAISIWYLRRSRRRGTLTTAQFNRTLIVPTIFGGSLWGGLPAAVGHDSTELFFLAMLISALACSVGYFWTLGHWPLSMIFALLILGGIVGLYRDLDMDGAGVIMAFGPILFVTLFGISVMAQAVLVRAYYYEATARDREQWLGLVLEDYERGGQDFLWQTDPQLRFTYVPTQMLNAVHGDPRAAEGRSLASLLADCPDALAAIREGRAFDVKVSTSGPNTRGEVRLWGRPKVVRGAALGYHGVGSDEDAARRAAETERTSERLDAMVALTSGLAHDFNNQLATVLGAVELAALDEDISETTLGYLQRAVDACLRTRRITADLVVASGYDATYQPIVFKIGPAVHEVAADLETQFPNLDFNLREDGSGWVLADRDHFMRAIHNLMQNACQAVADMPSDRRRVDVRVHTVDDRSGNPLVCTDVSDEGPGVPTELSERIFEPFSTTRRSIGGTGLGLSVARGFAHQAHGSLTLERTTQGALFRLSVPATDPPTSQLQHVGSRSSAAEASPRLTGRFLVVEDDDQVADNIATLLRSFGGRAEVATSVAEAITQFAGRTADIECVISDLVLPDGEGYEVIAALRQQHPSLRAIYMSGFTRTLPADVDPDLQCPFLAKPFSASELAAALGAVGLDAQEFIEDIPVLDAVIGEAGTG